MYGPTETTIWSSVHRVGPSGQSPVVELGHPIANTQFYILDEQRELVPPGVSGELYIAGDGVARGYYNRPELTNEKFVPDPFAQKPGARMYRTGDRVRRSSTGSLHYLERVDYQVKIRGYRVEIGDVEAAITRHENVKQAVVVAREDGGSGEKRLVAYLVANHDLAANGNGNGHNGQGPISPTTTNGNGHHGPVVGAMPSPGEWRIFLKEFLPDYMVPARFVVLDELPLTPNGKIDRKRLPLPEETEIYGDDFLAPRDSLELQLTKIWEKVLGQQPIGIRDNFFDLGGHSLMAVRLFMQIEQVFERSLPLAVLFQAPTIEQLATVLREQGWSSSWSSLVPLRAVGSAPPFFCVHSLGANLVSYQSLASRMDKDQPFFGLQPAGLDGKEESHTRIEEMAAHYLKEIRGLQPEGPYFLGGVCLGGTIAFEMAQQLKQAGEEVGLLALIDSYRPGPIDYMPRVYWQGLALLTDYHLGNMLMRDPGQQLRYLRERMRNLYFRVRRALQHGRAKTSAGQGSFEQNLRRVFEANSEAERHYKPEVYPGKITLFWSSETTTRSYLDRRLHWSELAANGFEVHAIPGDHMSMIEEPYVQVLATKLQAVIQSSS
jgi:aspartate racemase